MKIRDLILLVLVLGMVISTGTLVVFTTSGISDIKNITSEASSDELLSNASKTLETIAISIRDSLDSQMENQYEKVETWARELSLLELAEEAQQYSKEQLFEMWSAQALRKYTDGRAAGDGNPMNDLSPDISKYLARLSSEFHYPEIFITDNRGYVIAANRATGEFDQGPEDWGVVLENGAPVFKQINPTPEGEDWYAAAYNAKDRFYVSTVVWDESSQSWGIEIIRQLRDQVTDKYLGQIKAVFDYSTFVNELLNADEYDVYEIKVADAEGRILATSLEDKSKVTNQAVNIKEDLKLIGADWMQRGSTTESYADENSVNVYVGFALLKDYYNRNIVLVSEKDTYLEGPVTNFVDHLQSAIGDKSTTLQRNMIIIGAVVAVIIIIAAILIIRAKVSIPLKKLTAVSEKLSMGEIEGLEIDVHGKDEISSFGESFKGVLAAFNFLKDEAEKK